MDSLLVIGLTTVAFLAMIFLLATKAKVAGKLTGILIAVTAVSGLLIYGYGFAQTLDSLPLAVIRALLAVCGMFLGRNELSAIVAAPLLQPQWAQAIFWLFHLLALYITAGAAIITVGAEAMKKLRLWMVRRGNLNLLFGINEDTLQLGKRLMQTRGNPVVYIDNKAGNSVAEAVANFGGVLRTDADALKGSKKFLRSLAISRRGRQLTVYAMHKDPGENIHYAERLLKSLEQSGVLPEKTRLVILCQEDRAIRRLQVTEGSYGYGFVAAVNEAELAARVLVRNYPPYQYLTFDADAKATTNFEVLIVGFGQTAQAVLKQLVMNGQFEGSRFRAAVFAPDCDDVDGYFASSFDALLHNYDIAFYPCDARSRRMTAYLQEHGKELKYVAVCTGSDKMNREIAENLCGYFSVNQIAVPVYECSRQGVKAYDEDGTVVEQHPLYEPQLLNMEQLDRMAMILNHQYQQPTDRSALEEWMRCDYFSRQSSRASADFIGAMLRAAGKMEESSWDLTQQQLLNLSKTEHLRWCAFHHCMGFAAMTEEEFDRRADEYRRQLEETGKPQIRIAKNMSGRTHACLVSWEDLVKLSEKESAITGQQKDYQILDTQNVLAVPQLLKAAAGVAKK